MLAGRSDAQVPRFPRTGLESRVEGILQASYLFQVSETEGSFRGCVLFFRRGWVVCGRMGEVPSEREQTRFKRFRPPTSMLRSIQVHFGYACSSLRFLTDFRWTSSGCGCRANSSLIAQGALITSADSVPLEITSLFQDGVCNKCAMLASPAFGETCLSVASLNFGEISPRKGTPRRLNVPRSAEKSSRETRL